MSKTTTQLTVVIATAAFALLSAGTAMAQDKTRAEVVAELQAARNSGELAALTAEKGTEGYAAAVKATVLTAKPAAAPAVVGKTRAEVIAELAAAQASGELAQLRADAETGNFPSLNRRVPAATMLAGK